MRKRVYEQYCTGVHALFLTPLSVSTVYKLRIVKMVGGGNFRNFISYASPTTLWGSSAFMNDTGEFEVKSYFRNSHLKALMMLKGEMLPEKMNKVISKRAVMMETRVDL